MLRQRVLIKPIQNSAKNFLSGMYSLLLATLLWPKRTNTHLETGTHWKPLAGS